MNREVEAYLAELKVRRFSHSRCNRSERILERLHLYLIETHSVTDWRSVSETHLRDFAIYAATRHRTPRGRLISPATLRQWLSIIRSFFNWMCTRGHLLHSPAERLAFPRQDKPLPRVIGEREIARLIEAPNTETAIGIRDRALMETLYATGIRHAEAHRLDLYDVDTASRRLIIRLGKGRRDRMVPLTETASHWLARYITAARPELAAGLWWGKGRRRNKGKRVKSSSGPSPLGPLNGPAWTVGPTSALWLSMTGRRLSYQMIAERVRGYAMQAEVKATVHTFRHCCATHLLRGGAGLRHIQQLLGHRDLNSTEIYTHVEIDDLKKAIENTTNQA
jgi:integrase/recombinase XerD